MSNTSMEEVNIEKIEGKETVKKPVIEAIIEPEVLNTDNINKVSKPTAKQQVQEYLKDVEQRKKKAVDFRDILNPEQDYFFATPAREDRKYIYTPEVFKTPILASSNITTYSCLDSEYQLYESLLNSLEKLTDPNYIKKGDYVSIFEMMKEKIKCVHSELDLLEIIKYPSFYKSLLRKNEKIIFDEDKSKKDYKISSPITISLQIKNALSDEQGSIFLNPDIAEYRDQIIEYWRKENVSYKKPINYPVAKKGFVLLDELATKGVNSSIERFKDSEKFNAASKGLKTHTITLITYFGIVDILKAFTCEKLLTDVQELIRQEHLVHDKRLKEVNFTYKNGENYTTDEKIYNSGTNLKWIITHNGQRYKVKLEIIDLTALHGQISLNELFINCGIENEYKKSLDAYKSCMFEALLLEPKLYHEYALGDIRLFEAGSSYNFNLKKLYISLGIGEYFKETNFTIGSTVQRIIEAKFCKYMNISPARYLLMSGKEKEALFAHYTYLGSPKCLQQYSPYEIKNAHLFNGNTRGYNRILLSKADGGRAHCYRLLHSLTSKEKALCDIDISGAYTSKMSNQFYYVGDPIIDIRPTQDRITLRKHIAIYKDELGIDNYYMRVEGELKYEQDLIVSFIDAGKDVHKHIEVDSDKNRTVKVKHDLENTKNKILTKVIEDGAITPDILDLILNELSVRQKNDFLDNLYVKAFMYYAPSMELSSPEEYAEKLNAHLEGKIDCTYKKQLKYQDREKLKPFHHYIKIPYGEYLVDPIRTYRAKYKKEGNTAYDKMYKLIGNTVYGDNICKHFDTSNIIFANNITAGVRCGIWYAEKALNFVQSITDGGIFNPNRVPHPINNKFDTTSFVRAYNKTARELRHYKKCEFKPITRSKEPITFNKEKQQWLVDGQYYDEKGFKNIVAELSLEHIQKCFSKNKLVNAPTKHLDIKNIDFQLDNLEPKYTNKKGTFSFEVKDFISKASFSGQTNYTYTSWKGETKTKNRSYETRKNEDGTLAKPHTAFFLDKKGYLYLDEEFYKYTSPSEMFLNAIANDPEKVPLLPPFVISTIIKTKDWQQSFNKTYRYSNLNSGDTSHKIALRPLFEISAFKFQTIEQYTSWQKAHDKLKNKYGLTFELFFMNEDGTCNYKKMNDEIDKMIISGVQLPLKRLDPFNNMHHRIKNSLDVYLESIKQAKRWHRLSIVGFHKYAYEYHNEKDYLESIVFENELDYYNTNKYSSINEFKHHEEETA